MDPTLQAALAALIGAVVAGGAVLAWHISDRQQRTIPPYAQPVVPDGVGTVLSVLRSSAVVVDDNDEVLKASAPAYALGLVRGSKLVSADLADVVRKVRRDGQIRETELLMARPGVPSRYVTPASRRWARGWCSRWWRTARGRSASRRSGATSSPTSPTS